MGIQVVGSGGTVVGAGSDVQEGLHVVSKPHEVGSLGQYTIGLLSGIIPAAASANAEIFQFRWSDATRICLINTITISAVVSTTMFAAGVPVQIDLVKATAWSAAGSGGTRVSPAALLKKRTSMGSSLVAASDIAIITTTGTGLVAGTKTLEGTPLKVLLAAGPITGSLSGQIVPPRTSLLQSDTGDGMYPLALVQNEGFVIRSVAVPATGTWMVGVTVDWAEVSAF